MRASAAAWPAMEESTGEFGKKMNAMPRFVASRMRDNAEWDATAIRGDLATEAAKLKEEPGGDLLIYGSGDVVDELTRHGLIDEYRLMIHPVIVGPGKRLFNDLPLTTRRLVDSITTDTRRRGSHVRSSRLTQSRFSMCTSSGSSA